MAITVKGTITLRSNFEVELDMTEEEFESLSAYRQESEIQEEIDWRDWTESADIHDMDVFDIESDEEDEMEDDE